MSDLLERLQQRGWRLTAQRRVVAEVLRGEHVHLTAEEVHERARARLPEISMATVYNTLNELMAMGELLEVSPDGGPNRYDPNVTQPHHHLICLRCGEIRDVLPRARHLPDIPEDQRLGYRIVDVDIVFRGLCSACASRRAEDGEGDEPTALSKRAIWHRL